MIDEERITMWIFYYCSHGPGHQSTDYGFECFDDSMSMKDVREYIDDYCERFEWPVTDCWKVERPPADHVNTEVENTKRRIRSLQRYLRSLGTEENFVDEQEDGADPVVQRNLKGTIEVDLLKRLHRAGFMYSANDLSRWRYGKKHPVEPQRSKIFRIMRRTKKYPGY